MVVITASVGGTMGNTERQLVTVHVTLNNEVINKKNGLLHVLLTHCALGVGVYV